jgi:DNA-binding CsgD family transcriptional regulator
VEADLPGPVTTRPRARAAPAADAAPAAAPVPPLSRTQRDVLRCLVRGMADKEISAHLQLSTHTVDYHLRQLRKRFGARNRVQLLLASRGMLAETPAPLSPSRRKET